MPATAKPDDERPDDELEAETTLTGEDATEVAEKARREAARLRRELRAVQQTNDELRGELERRRVETESETERAVREAVEAERERLAGEFAGERLQARVLVRATGKLREPDDAWLHLGGVLDPDADNAAIDAALEQLVAERDYLAAPSANGVSAGLVTQGARSSSPRAAGLEHSPDDWIRARVRSK